MRRRELTGFIGWTSTTWALPAYTREGENRKRIGVLIGRPENDAEGQSYKIAFQQALKEMRRRPCDNVVIDYRWMAGDPRLTLGDRNRRPQLTTKKPAKSRGCRKAS
jgi:hypothetical protein